MVISLERALPAAALVVWEAETLPEAFAFVDPQRRLLHPGWWSPSKSWWPWWQRISDYQRCHDDHQYRNLISCLSDFLACKRTLLASSASSSFFRSIATLSLISTTWRAKYWSKRQWQRKKTMIFKLQFLSKHKHSDTLWNVFTSLTNLEWGASWQASTPEQWGKNILVS